VYPDTLADFIFDGQAEDPTVEEAPTALGLCGGYLAEVYSILAILLHQY
jgi:hypothetical protein